jgi:hypothetical protein
MKIHFSTKKLQKIFNSNDKLIKHYGADQTIKIKLRMSTLKSAVNLAQVPTDKPERRHQLQGKRSLEFALDLKQPFRLIFKPKLNSHNEKYDLTSITEIIILGVENYHDK